MSTRRFECRGARLLTEEAHHMFVGESGIMRIVQRTAELMGTHDTEDEIGRAHV